MSTAPECYTIPAVVTEGYVEKGKWIELAGLKTYVTGNETSSKEIVAIYDIFGPAPQTLQGADLMAATLSALVLVPDFFKGECVKSEWLADPENEEHKRLRSEFLKTNAGDRERHGKALLKVVDGGGGGWGGEKWGSVKSWGAFGLCWGGKIAVMNSQKGTPFKVTGQVHPGSYTKEDAEKVAIPHIVLPSKGEDVEVTKAYTGILTGEGKTGVVETYPTMHHGWMGARANLKDAYNLKEYTRRYNQLASYFANYL